MTYMIVALEILLCYIELLCVVWCTALYRGVVYGTLLCLSNCNSPHSTFLFFSSLVFYFTLLYLTLLYFSFLIFTFLPSFLFFSFLFLSFFFNHLGGKRPFNSVKNVDRNPCFCLKPSKCILVATGKIKIYLFNLFSFFIIF